jgi:hypothetical protein
MYITDIDNSEKKIAPRIYFSNASQQLIIEGLSLENGIVTLTDLNGRRINKMPFEGEKVQLPLSTAHNGIILVTVEQGDFLSTQKVYIR